MTREFHQRDLYVSSITVWLVKIKIEQRINVAEMRMLRWVSKVTNEYRIRNEYIKSYTCVNTIVDNMRENKHRRKEVKRKTEKKVVGCD